jgi:hypothetical protein
VDITQHLRVISRWRKVLITSAILGLALAALFTLKISFSGGPNAGWRHAAKWESKSRIFVTQAGFPWGRTTLPDGREDPKLKMTLAEKQAAADAANDPNSPAFADPGRLSLLAIIYAFMSQSNTVSTINAKPLPEGSEVTAVEISDQNQGALPMFQLNATAETEATANAVNTERSQALMNYLTQQQDAYKVPAGQRVKLSVLNKPYATKVSGHGEMLGVAMLFLALAAGVSTCYLLESLRLSRERQAAAEDPFNGEVLEPVSWSNGAPSSPLHDAPQRSVR